MPIDARPWSRRLDDVHQRCGHHQPYPCISDTHMHSRKEAPIYSSRHPFPSSDSVGSRPQPLHAISRHSVTQSSVRAQWSLYSKSNQFGNSYWKTELCTSVIISFANMPGNARTRGGQTDQSTKHRIILPRRHCAKYQFVDVDKRTLEGVDARWTHGDTPVG